jgi:hypothetical protein
VVTGLALSVIVMLSPATSVDRFLSAGVASVSEMMRERFWPPVEMTFACCAVGSVEPPAVFHRYGKNPV